MAVRSKKKKAGIRRTNRRRIHQVQGLFNPAVQSDKAALAFILKALDPDRDSCAQWSPGFVRPGVYPRLGQILGTVYKSLQRRVLPPQRLRRVRVEAPDGRISPYYRRNIPFDFANVCGRISPNAGIGIPKLDSFLTPEQQKAVRRIRKRLPGSNGIRGGSYCPQCGRRWNQTSASCQWSAIHRQTVVEGIARREARCVRKSARRT